MSQISRIACALTGNAKRQFRILSGIKPRPKAPVLGRSLTEVLERHAWLCRQLQQLLPEGLDIRGTEVCEVGPGDCLATAALAIGLGAKRIDLVEIQPPLVNAKQLEVLRKLQAEGFPVSTNVLKENSSTELNPERIAYHVGFMDDFEAVQKFSFIYSFCVLEHVENLQDFFSACFRATQPGGYNLHMIDLGGHGEWEDPVPPLDFQTLPDWLYDLMYPRFHRATRRFVGQYVRAMEASGFVVTKLHRLREADSGYLETIRPKLRPAARSIPPDEIGVIEFAVEARRPISE